MWRVGSAESAACCVWDAFEYTTVWVATCVEEHKNNLHIKNGLVDLNLKKGQVLLISEQVRVCWNKQNRPNKEQEQGFKHPNANNTNVLCIIR